MHKNRRVYILPLLLMITMETKQVNQEQEEVSEEENNDEKDSDKETEEEIEATDVEQEFDSGINQILSAVSEQANFIP